MNRTSNAALIRESQEAVTREDEANKIADWLESSAWRDVPLCDMDTCRFVANQIRLHAHRPPPGRREETPNVE